MNVNQLNILNQLFWSPNVEIMEISYKEPSQLWVRYRDNGGNVFYRHYSRTGRFTELEV